MLRTTFLFANRLSIILLTCCLFTQIRCTDNQPTNEGTIVDSVPVGMPVKKPAINEFNNYNSKIIQYVYVSDRNGTAIKETPHLDFPSVKFEVLVKNGSQALKAICSHFALQNVRQLSGLSNSPKYGKAAWCQTHFMEPRRNPIFVPCA